MRRIVIRLRNWLHEKLYREALPNENGVVRISAELIDDLQGKF
jgi:hypothetical protein